MPEIERDLGLSPFVGDSEMAGRCRSIDWANTPLGSVDEWPLALRTAVRMVLESPFPINLWCGPNLQLIYNDGYTRLLGAKHPRALGRPGQEVWAEIWPQIGPWFDAIRAGGPPIFAEDARFLMERAHGPPEEAWFTFSLSPVRDERGAVVAFLNIASETTRRVLADRATSEARAAAERAESYLREVFTQAPAFMAVLDGPDHVVDFVNDAYSQLIGHRDVIGKPIREALPEVVEQGFVSLLDDVLNTGEPYIGRAVPVMLERTPGEPMEERFVDFVYQPLTNSAGQRIGIVVHGSDVTESVVAQSAVRENEARYRFLANAIPVQVWTATPEGALDYVSDRTAAYFGRTVAEVIGEQWLSVLHPDDAQATLARWRESLATGAEYEMEFRLWSAAHQCYRWHLARATPQRDETGRIIRWFGTNTEIEDWKQAESELKRLTAEATEANHAKSAFLAAMSHELRTPLNAIGGYAQLIEMGVRGPITEEQRVDLLKIQRSKNHLDALVSDVLNFAKLGSGKIEYDIRDVGVQQMLNSVVEMIAPQLVEKHLTLEPCMVANDLAIRGDEDKVRQILLNLLANALKFTPAQGIIAFAVRAAESDVAIDVRDTGIGIPADHLERIFEPFVQAKRALQASDQGVGLGLAISRQLARAMRGELTVRSAVGEGSTFTLTLPRARITATSSAG